ncbi:hypothetical protein [Gluconobacter sp.]|uniref:hypothetical protein n=1 Tax=Gluconobacter sp. TaxID=1876758 RepID=UPI0039EA1F22
MGSRTSLPIHYPVFVISSRDEMERIIQSRKKRFFALSAESAGNSFGVPWWLEVVGSHAGLSVLDCGGSPAIARQALDARIGWAICRTSAPQLQALEAYAPYRGRILTLRPPSSPGNNLRERAHDSL